MQQTASFILKQIMDAPQKGGLIKELSIPQIKTHIYDIVLIGDPQTRVKIS